LSFDTTFVAVGDETDQTYTIKIKATIKEGIEAVKEVNVSIGCYQETELNSNIAESLPDPWVEGTSGLEIVIPPLASGDFDTNDPSTYILSFYLDSLVTYETDAEGCGPYQVQLCIEVDCSSVTDITDDLTSL